MCCLCLSPVIPHVLDSVVCFLFPFSFLSISVFYVSSVLCYNHSSSINSSLLHLPKTWIVSNSFTTIRGSTLQANMSGVEHKEGDKKKKWSAFMSRCDLFKWDLEPGSEILFSCVHRASFFLHKIRDADARQAGFWFLKGLVRNWADQRNINFDHFTLIRTRFRFVKFKLFFSFSNFRLYFSLLFFWFQYKVLLIQKCKQG